MTKRTLNKIYKNDPIIAQLIDYETQRQNSRIGLIASENDASPAIMQALGSPLINKYSEGYPGKRFYGGNQYIDKIETLAINRAKEIFEAEHVNVQPLSGSPANQAVFFALLNLGDKFMGLNLSSGGHLTHGSPVNFSGRNYNSVSYDVDKATGMLDMDNVREIAKKERPKMIISGLTSYPRKIDFEAFQSIADEVNAYHLSDISHIAGLIAGGVHESPIQYADVVTTTTHKSLRGPRGAIIMCKTQDKYDNKSLARKIDSAVFPGLQGGPHDNITAAKAICFKEALEPGFKDYAQQIVYNAKALADELIANDIKLVTGGTDNHLMLVDLNAMGLPGKGQYMQEALETVGLTVNKNTVPYDPASPRLPSGIRLGTPSVTTRGMKEPEMKIIGKCIADIIHQPVNVKAVTKVRNIVSKLAKAYPLPY